MVEELWWGDGARTDLEDSRAAQLQTARQMTPGRCSRKLQVSRSEPSIVQNVAAGEIGVSQSMIPALACLPSSREFLHEQGLEDTMPVQPSDLDEHVLGPSPTSPDSTFVILTGR
jgi:hypothetical protein